MKDNKHLKWGVFLGAILIIGSIEVLFSSSYDLNVYFICFTAIALLLGVSQLLLSLNYKTQKYKTKVLFFIFCLELFYYIGAILYAKNYFAIAIGVVMMILIIFILVHLYAVITKERREAGTYGSN